MTTTHPHREVRGTNRKAARAAPAGAAVQAASGLPRYLAARLGRRAFGSAAVRGDEAAAEAFAEGRPGAAGQLARSTAAAAPAVAAAREGVRAASRALPAGEPLRDDERRAFGKRLGVALDGVRLHDDAASGAFADALGARAFAIDGEVYFGSGRRRPGTAEGDRLLAHELAHVAQHGGSGARGGQMHGDLAMSLPVPLGAFEIDFADRVAPMTPGMEGHVTFDPAPPGPYSAEIGLLQAVRIEAGGLTSGIGSGLGFGGPAEATRDVLATTGSGGEEAGWHVDTTYSDPAKTEGSQTSPSYPQSVGFSPGDNEHGFLRSPTDLAPARLYDYPGSPRPQIRYDFETVARGLDTGTVYGGLRWGFELLAGVPRNEYARAEAATSAEFDLSLDRFRAHFTHEPVVVYFDTASDVPAAGEGAKLDEAAAWLARFSDARVEIEGHADEAGPAGPNLALSQRRADAVAVALAARGLDAARIDFARGGGETGAFAAGAEAGQLRANRRAVVRFIRHASTPPAP